MGVSEKQLEEIWYSDKYDKLTLHDLVSINFNDNNSNRPNKSFDHDKEYQKGFEKSNEDEDLATNKA